jgi:purine-binding chemotaxis protein CheW
MNNVEGKYMTFTLKNEIYGIPIGTVKEINAMMTITEVPNTPKYIKGVINLRGKIISIMDLRLRLGMEEIDYSERTCIIVVEVPNNEKGKKKIGIVVDHVAEVIEIKNSELEDFEEDLVDDLNAFINGIAKMKDKIIIILDIEKIVNNVETVEVN